MKLPAALLVAGAWLLAAGINAAELQLSSLTDAGRYRIAIRPAEWPVPVGETHAWIVGVATPDGDLFVPMQFVVDGGMQGHGHGLPTQPMLTRRLDNGELRLDGVRFNMPGEWTLTIGLRGAAGWDRVAFRFEIGDTGEVALLESLALSALPAVPPDPSNRVSTDPAAARLGHALFFDQGLSRNGEVACATCHQPARHFTDGRVRSSGLGLTDRHAPMLIGAAYSPWLYWDGRRDSLWAQALTPLEAPVEMGSTRVGAVRHLLTSPGLLAAYRQAFGDPRSRLAELPDSASPLGDPADKAAWQRLPLAVRRAVNSDFSNLGKAVAAYESLLLPAPSRFDRYVAARRAGDPVADELLSEDERAGLALYLDPDKGQCLRCHNGPLFTNHGFQNVGTGVFSGARLDYGRLFGIRAVLFDEFNCLGDYSDAPADGCASLRYLNPEPAPQLQGAFKVPSLRNVAATAPYGHDGRFATLEDVIDHYRQPPEQAARLSELNPLPLSDRERDQLVAFLGTLSSNVAAEAQWLRPPVAAEELEQ